MHDLHIHLPLLPETIESNGHTKLVYTQNDKKYVTHIRNIKQTLEHDLKFKKVHKAIVFHQEAWLKQHFEENTKLRKKPNNEFARDLLKMLNNAVFGKSMQNVRKHRDIKLVTSNKKRCKLASKPNYHTTKWFSENVLAIEMKKKQK